MKIKTESESRLLVHCCYRLSPVCKDKEVDHEILKKVAAIFKVDGISSGICSACNEIMERDIRKQELLALKENLPNKHG